MTKLFIVVDSVSNDLAVSGNAVTPGVFVRTNAPVLSKICPTFLQDFKLYEVASFNGLNDDGSPSVSVYDDPVYCSWDCYKFPEAPVRDMSPEEIQAMKK